MPTGWSSIKRTGPAVDPVRLNSGLPRRAGSRASAQYRFFGRDCWPQGQLDEWYSSKHSARGARANDNRSAIYGILLLAAVLAFAWLFSASLVLARDSAA
jgi:hypothetical protein